VTRCGLVCGSCDSDSEMIMHRGSCVCEKLILCKGNGPCILRGGGWGCDDDLGGQLGLQPSEISRLNGVIEEANLESITNVDLRFCDSADETLVLRHCSAVHISWLDLSFVLDLHQFPSLYCVNVAGVEVPNASQILKCARIVCLCKKALDFQR
jgi:hypothetical protein